MVSPLYNTKATADVLLGAVAQLGGSLASAVPFSDEVAFIQHNVADLANKDGLYSAPTFEAFWTLWQQSGGWWQKEPDAVAPQSPVNFDHPITQNPAQYLGDPNQFPYYLMPYPAPNLGDGSAANRPVLQESPDPMTTVMWNSWVEINTQTAGKLGLKTNDLVNITTPIGSVQAVVYVYPAIHPEVIAMPLGQGHTTFGRYASGRGFNPLTILSPALNEAGNLAFMSTRAQIVPLIGKTYPLARYESEEGVYHNQNFVGGQL